MLLLFAGATPSSSPPVVTSCGFQPSAFQNNAFQNCATTKKVVGWMPEWRFRHDPEELERRLKEQGGFSRTWFDRFLVAEKAALTRAQETKSEKHRIALEDVVQRLHTAIEIEQVSLEEAATLLRAAAFTTRLTASLRACERIIGLICDQEDEEILLLLDD